ncbi:MAG: YciI family protein [Bacteroidota bacterium]
MILLKGKGELDYAPDMLQQRIEEYREWCSEIAENYVSDNRLERTGASIKNRNKIITDGPFLDAKEVIAGFIIIKALDLDAAIKIANSSPLLKYLEMILRPLVEMD